MGVNVKLNDYKYRYDIYHIFNIYFPLQKIDFSHDEGEYDITVMEDGIIYRHNDIYLEAKFTDKEKPKETIKKLLFKELKRQTGDIYPWGTLIGIRPSKIALKHLHEGKSEEDIREIFKEKYYALEDKSQMCIDVARMESKYVNKDPKCISIYIGMAFCPTRCLYCSFASNPINGAYKDMIGPYIKALSYEIDSIREYIQNRGLTIETVYFGGGTPTSIDEISFENIMNKIYNSFVKDKNIKEFTVECGRPDSITIEKLKTMKKYNVSRISINPQTMNDDTLKLIGRNHTSYDVYEKFNMARELGFSDINMDIIIGLPGEGLEHIKKTVNELKKLKPDSITIHGLALKRGSIMFDNFIMKKGLGIKSQEEISKMYLESKNLADELGLSPYYMYRQRNMVGNMENIGYAKEGKHCLYNIEMIEDNQTIIALGADAVSKVVFMEENRLERFGNVKDVKEYVNRINELVEGKIALLDTLYKEE